jgi:hypothetical protein
MKNASTSSTSGKHWGKLTGSVSEGYQQVGGESHSSVKSGPFCGPTKGNRDLPPNRSDGVAGGYGGGPHKAGGK